MSGVQLFQFEPTYSPGEEPAKTEEASKREKESLSLNARVGNTKWCICGGNCIATTTADECFCCQGLETWNQKFDESVIERITSHSKFRIVPRY